MTVVSPTIRTDLERQVLTLHAGGATVDAICNQLGRTSREVNDVLTRLSRFDRAEATRLVGASVTPPQSGVDDMLARAQATGLPRLCKLVDRIRGLVEELDAKLAVVEREAQIRRRIAELQHDLGQAEQELRAVRHGEPVPHLEASPAAATRGDPRLIRRWAADQKGMRCPALGPIPKAVRQAYEAAHRD